MATTQYIVVSSIQGEPGGLHGCIVVPSDTLYPEIYSRAFGPDTREACQQWVHTHCGSGSSTFSYHPSKKEHLFRAALVSSTLWHAPFEDRHLLCIVPSR